MLQLELFPVTDAGRIAPLPVVDIRFSETLCKTGAAIHFHYSLMWSDRPALDDSDFDDIEVAQQECATWRRQILVTGRPDIAELLQKNYEGLI